MVQAIHTAGLGYIMDVVYNHTTDTSVFNNIVPGYYYRTDDFGNYNNGSGLGNEVATDRPQVFKFAEDSMKYWITQYHVDGFRMDQMYLFGKTQLTQLTKDSAQARSRACHHWRTMGKRRVRSDRRSTSHRRQSGRSRSGGVERPLPQRHLL